MYIMIIPLTTHGKMQNNLPFRIWNTLDHVLLTYRYSIFFYKISPILSTQKFPNASSGEPAIVRTN